MARILIDVDGVLGGFDKRFLQVINEFTGLSYHPKDIKSWGFFHCLGRNSTQQLILDDPQLQKLCFEEVSKKDFCRSIEIYDGVVDEVAKLVQLGHEVVFVTSPWASSPYWYNERKEWLKEHFGDIVDIPNNLIFASGSQKAFVYGDVLIEDNHNNLKGWVKHNQVWGILINKTFNSTKDLDVDGRLWIVRSDKLDSNMINEAVNVFDWTRKY